MIVDGDEGLLVSPWRRNRIFGRIRMDFASSNTTTIDYNLIMNMGGFRTRFSVTPAEKGPIEEPFAIQSNKD